MPAVPRDPTTEGLLLVTAALETGLLAALERARPASELADLLGLEQRVVRACVEALVELGVAEPAAGGHRLTDFGRRRFLDAGSRENVGPGLPQWRASLRGWLFLDDALRGGPPLPEDSTPEGWERLYASLDAKTPARNAGLVARVLRRAPLATPRVLDVGGGSGRHARAFLARGCTVTLLERPEVLSFTRRRFGLEGLAGLRLIEGDARRALPPGPFDVLLAADVLHEMGPEEARALLHAAARSAAPGAVLAVAEPLLGRSRGAALVGVGLTLYTARGRTYAEDELREWVEEAGFAAVEVEDLDAGLALLTARRTPPSRGSG